MIYYAEGTYQMEVTEHRLGKTSNGNPQWVVRGKIQNRIHTDGSTEPVQANYERNLYRVITEKTVPYLMEDLEALGAPPLTTWAQLDQGTAGCWDLRGQWIEVVCKHGNYNGNDREEWGFNTVRATTLDVTPLNAQEMRDLNNLFGKALKGVKANGKATPTAPKPAAKPVGMVSSPKPRPAAPKITDPDMELGPTPIDDDMPF